MAEGFAVLNQELKSPEEKTEADTRGLVEQDQTAATGVNGATKEASQPAFGSAAAFLGFRYSACKAS